MGTSVAPSSLDNDTRGWIMCIVSGIGDMLPESKEYFEQAKWSQQAAGLVMMACFVGGFIGIQGVSRLLHQFMPTHVVECDHTHEENATKDSSCQHERRQSRASRARRQASYPPASQSPADKTLSKIANGNGQNAATESTPLLESTLDSPTTTLRRQASARDGMRRPASPIRSRTATGLADGFPERRKSIRDVQKRVMSFVQDTKCNCDESNSCYGFSDPCGQECFKHLNSRPSLPSRPGRQPQILRTTTGSFLGRGHENSYAPHDHQHDHDHDHEHSAETFVRPTYRTSRAKSREPLDPIVPEESSEHDDSCSSAAGEEDVEAQQHHHHVPTNAFLSIGLQTSIAIALHKFPEGFITYATNHVNPSLGFNVFMALFVHNITEGFAMCLPLYMALGSRWRAMAWSAFLGGLSQPIGAGVAALWFKLADKTNMQPNAVAYACLFAITSGIMVSVALQLFVESLSLNHSRNLCIFFGFLGMALLGLSNALVGSH
ncbi:ZIP zinc transporter-domain-containing protein [Fusarium acuminatum]|uniref:ZIP zinc transporter-domain-containing protein n=1 Tax=Fusarium acuminatum TaxID=5515 RepID=A0ABZ2WWX8_9HYPO